MSFLSRYAWNTPQRVSISFSTYSGTRYAGAVYVIVSIPLHCINVEIFCLVEGITSVALCSQPSCPLLSLAFHLVREEPRPKPRPNCTLVIWEVGGSVG